ncbi:uncharacterized protein ACNLHF_000144 [Anomaloglossus baeobatrachus]
MGLPNLRNQRQTVRPYHGREPRVSCSLTVDDPAVQILDDGGCIRVPGASSDQDVYGSLEPRLIRWGAVSLELRLLRTSFVVKGHDEEEMGDTGCRRPRQGGDGRYGLQEATTRRRRAIRAAGGHDKEMGDMGCRRPRQGGDVRYGLQEATIRRRWEIRAAGGHDKEEM